MATPRTDTRTGKRRNRGTGNRPNTDQSLEMVTRAVQARRDGATWQAAANAAGYNDRSQCRKSVLAFLRAEAVETVEEWRTLLVMRHERRLLTLMPVALGQRNPDGTWATPPDMDALIECRRIDAELARLVGANAPTKVEVTTELDAEIKRLAEELSIGHTGDITEAAEDREEV